MKATTPKGMKSCVCGKNIAKGATKCPNCGKNYTPASRVILLVIIGGLIGWIMISAMGIPALIFR